MAHQISLFVENKPGKMAGVMKALRAKAIDVKAFTINSAGTFGVIKLLVNEPVRAREVLKNTGLAVALVDVVVIVLDELPDGLETISSLFTDFNVNIETAYGFNSGGHKLLVIETNDADRLKTVCDQQNIPILTDTQIYAL